MKAKSDAVAASPTSVLLAFVGDFAIAVFRHPARARQVRIMNMAEALRIEIWIEAEQNSHGFTPVGAITGGIEQAQIQDHVIAIIGRQSLTGRRFIQKLRR